MSIFGIVDSQSRIVSNGLILNVDSSEFRSYFGSGRTWLDLSGRNYNATASCATSGYIDNCTDYPPFTTSEGIRYWDFTVNSSGNNRMMTFPQLIPSTNSFTVEIWLKRNSTSVGDRESIFSNANGADGYRFGINTNGTLYYLIGGIGGAGYSEGTVGSGYSVTTDTWTQAVMVWDRSAQLGSYRVIAHTNGVQRGTANINSGNQAFAGDGLPGVSRWCCARYKGSISIIRAYNKALTSSEVLQNYNATKIKFRL